MMRFLPTTGATTSAATTTPTSRRSSRLRRRCTDGDQLHALPRGYARGPAGGGVGDRQRHPGGALVARDRVCALCGDAAMTGKKHTPNLDAVRNIIRRLLAAGVPRERVK